MNIFKKNVETNKYIALSFDDGPNGKNTLQILKTLKKHNAKATFFLVGSRIENYTVDKNMYAKYGCEIGNHTWMHDDILENSKDYIYDSIKECQDAIDNTYHVKTTLMRTPGGKINKDILSVLEELNLYAILWSVDSRDWETKDINRVVLNVLKDIKDGDIVLMHDKDQTTIDALNAILNELEKQGYSVVTISELFKLKNITLKPNTIYKNAR